MLTTSSNVFRIDALADPVSRELGTAASIPDEDTVPPQPRRSWYVPVKLAAEWMVALVLFILASPLMAILAAIVKLTSDGPALYAQTRLGRVGRMYRIYKLRTMQHNAEATSGPVWAAKNDRRVTPVGRFLRDSHLDELPQLWNVLRGEMSLIGPRPERPEIASRVATRLPNFYHRLQVRPGITGLSQMLLPADDPDDRRYDGVELKLAHDLLYVRELSPLLDVRVAIGTAIFFLGGRFRYLRHGLLKAYALRPDEDPAQRAEELLNLEEQAA